MTKFEWLHPLSIGGTLLYALMGIIIFWAAFIIIDKITPHDLWREIVEKQNKALGWWWPRCAWASASSWRRRFIEALGYVWHCPRGGLPTVPPACKIRDLGPGAASLRPPRMPTLDWLHRAAASLLPTKCPTACWKPSAPRQRRRKRNDNFCSSTATTSRSPQALTWPTAAAASQQVFIDPPCNTQSAFEHYDDQAGTQPVAQHDAAPGWSCCGTC